MEINKTKTKMRFKNFPVGSLALLVANVQKNCGNFQIKNI